MNISGTADDIFDLLLTVPRGMTSLDIRKNLDRSRSEVHRALGLLKSRGYAFDHRDRHESVVLWRLCAPIQQAAE